MTQKEDMTHLALKLCMTKDIGLHGNLFGGILLAWLDESAATWACQVCKNPYVVTAKMDELIFENPVKAGQQVNIYGKVVKMGRTSLTMYVEARHQDFYTAEEQIVCSTTFVFVQVNEQTGRPKPILDSVRNEYAHLD